MSSIKTENNHMLNPFKTEKADYFWKTLRKEGKQITKKELIKSIEALKSNKK